MDDFELERAIMAAALYKDHWFFATPSTILIVGPDHPKYEGILELLTEAEAEK